MLAQLVEQRIFNPWAVGSNPSHPTKYIIGDWHIGGVLDSKSNKVGSIPTSPANLWSTK